MKSKNKRRDIRYLYLLGLVILSLKANAQFSHMDSCDWTVMPEAGISRLEAQSATVGEKLYVFAGFLEGLQITDATEIFDTESNSWSSGTPMPTAVTHMGAVVVGKTVWIIGGFVGNHPGIPTAQVQIYDTLTDTWSSGPQIPNPTGSGAAVFNEGKIHFFGGLGADRQTDVGDHFILDTQAIELGWVSATPLPYPRNHLSAVAIDGKVYAIGGQFGHDVTFSDQNYLHEYDPITEIWEEKASLLRKSSHFEPGTTVYEGKIIIVGGRSAADFLENISVYDPNMNLWTEFPCMLPDNLLAPVAKVIHDQLYVAAGGANGICCPLKRLQKIALSSPTLAYSDYEPHSLPALSIGPNPANEFMEVQVTTRSTMASDTVLYLVSLEGELLQSHWVDLSGGNARITMDIGDLATGLYLLVMRSDQGVFYSKKIVKR